MFFNYLTGELPEPPPPGLVYARIDRLERLDDTGRTPSTVLLDCIDAPWLRGVSRRVRHLSDKRLDEADVRISVVVVPSKHLGGVIRNDDDSPEWFRLELGDPHRGPVAEQFHNLFQGPAERGVISAQPVTASEGEMLRKLAGWQGIETTDQSEVDEVLTRIRPVDAVAIYDVGQGAATAPAIAWRTDAVLRCRRISYRQLA